MDRIMAQCAENETMAAEDLRSFMSPGNSGDPYAMIEAQGGLPGWLFLGHPGASLRYALDLKEVEEYDPSYVDLVLSPSATPLERFFHSTALCDWERRLAGTYSIPYRSLRSEFETYYDAGRLSFPSIGERYSTADADRDDGSDPDDFDEDSVCHRDRPIRLPNPILHGNSSEASGLAKKYDLAAPAAEAIDETDVGAIAHSRSSLEFFALNVADESSTLSFLGNTPVEDQEEFLAEMDCGRVPAGTTQSRVRDAILVAALVPSPSARVVAKADTLAGTCIEGYASRLGCEETMYASVAASLGFHTEDTRSLCMFCYDQEDPCGCLPGLGGFCVVCELSYNAHILVSREMKLMRFAALCARTAVTGPVTRAFGCLRGESLRRRPVGGHDLTREEWPPCLRRHVTASSAAFYAVEQPAWELASALRLAHPRFSTHPVVAARLSEEKRLASLAEEAIKVRPRRRRASKKSSRTRNWKKPGAGGRKAMAASDGAGAGAGGGCTGSRGAAR